MKCNRQDSFDGANEKHTNVEKTRNTPMWEKEEKPQKPFKRVLGKLFARGVE